MLHPYAIAFEELWRATAPASQTEDAPPDDEPTDDDDAAAGAPPPWVSLRQHLTIRRRRLRLPHLRPRLLR